MRYKHVVSDTHNKLDLYYLATDQGSGCGGDIYNFDGTFSSPNYGEIDQSNQLCRWNIVVPHNMTIQFHFLDFNMGSIETCDSNYMEIIETNRDGEETSQKFCGISAPYKFISRTNMVSVRFKKSINFNGSGFILGFESSESGYVM